MPTRRKVILDTDIGTDIDDSWALGLLLKSPELQLELVLTATGDTRYRAAVAARFLQKAGSPSIPIGIGIKSTGNPPFVQTLSPCLEEDYLGKAGTTVYDDGIAQAIRLFESEDEMTVIAIGPLTNIGELCRRRPDLIGKVRLVAMGGSIRKNFHDDDGQVAEYNITEDIQAAQAVFSASWKEFILTPLDHCGNLILRGEDYRRIARADTPLTREILYEYHTWLKYMRLPSDGQERESSVLFDTAAVHLATTTEDSELKRFELVVDERGFLRESPEGKPVLVALDWKNRDCFLRSLSNALIEG